MIENIRKQKAIQESEKDRKKVNPDEKKEDEVTIQLSDLVARDLAESRNSQATL